jgi:hypothetical protein
MTQAPTNLGNRGRSKPSSDIYTVLVIVAFIALAGAIAVVWLRSAAVFGTKHPFEIHSVSTVVGPLFGLG